MAWYDDFNINELLSSPGAAIGVPLGLGLLSGASPGTARAAAGLVGGANLVSRAQQQRDEDLKRKKLQELMPQIFGATNTVETPAELPASDRMDLSADAELPAVQPQQSQPLYNTKTETPLYSPQERNFGATVGAVDPALAVGFAASRIPRPTAPLHPLVERNLESQIRTREQPKTPAPLHPLQEENLRSQIQTRGQPTPLHPLQEENLRSQINRRELPPPMHPLQAQNLQSQINSRGQEDAVRQERLNKLREAAKVVGDPKSTLGQLAAWGNFLERSLQSYDTPAEDKPAIIEQLRQIRARVTPPAAGAPAAVDPNDPLGIRRRAEY